MDNNTIKIIFLGQCGFLISFNNKNILIDAVLNDLLDKEGKTRRLYPCPFKASDIKVDYMLFSHEHRDHFAYESAKDASFRNFKNKLLEGPMSIALSLSETERNDERVNASVEEMMDEYVW